MAQMASLAPRPAACESFPVDSRVMWDEAFDRFCSRETNGVAIEPASEVSRCGFGLAERGQGFEYAHEMWVLVVLPDRRRLRSGALVQPFGRASSRTEAERQPGAQTSSSRVDQQEPHSMVRSRRV
jgi:hypothetical protein